MTHSGERKASDVYSGRVNLKLRAFPFGSDEVDAFARTCEATVVSR
jgi:hypothetical protein